MGGLVALLVVLVLIVLILASCIKIVPQAQAYVVERLGAYQQTWSVGLHSCARAYKSYAPGCSGACQARKCSSFLFV